MVKLMFALTAALLVVDGQRRFSEVPRRLKEERMILEYSVTTNRATVVMEAESEESLESVVVRSPRGELLVDLRAGIGRHLSLSGFQVESGEFEAATLLASYAEGDYDLSGETVQGRAAEGRARLSHELPRAPTLLFPRDGSVDVPRTPRITWAPVPEADRYVVMLEQGESDTLRVELPAGSSFLQVPAGVLARRTPTHVEVGALLANGNRTMVEADFVTR